MGKFIKDQLLSNTAFWVCAIVAGVLLILGFLTPPVGDINNSVLVASGICFAFASLGAVIDAIRLGYDAKITHGSTSVELNNNEPTS